jgi:outer membrane protein
MRIARALVGILLMTAFALPASAQSMDMARPVAGSPAPSATFSGPAETRRLLAFSAVFGVQVSPPYFGSDEMDFGPSFRGGLGAIRVGPINYSGGEDSSDPYRRANGFGYGVAFRFIGPRNSDDYDELDGLDDIDATVEIGGAVGYVWPNLEALVDARYGFGGSNGWVSEARLNYVARPTDNIAIRIGPRVLWGSDNYTDTYFGVTESESEDSSFAEYDPGAGLVSAGLEAIATYRLSDSWWLEGAVKWLQFQGDAADSPIVEQGSNDWTQVRIGLRRNFTLRF